MPQIVQSFCQLPISLIVNLANGFILAAVLWNAMPTPILLTWSGLLIAVTGARFLTLRAFRNASPSSESDHAYWTKYFLAGTCAAGVVWGLSGILLFHPSSFPHQVVLAFVLGGMVAGAVPLLSSVRHAYWCFAIPIVVPISIRLMWVGDRIHLVMGLMMVIFGLTMLATSIQVQRLFRDAEKLRRELYSAIEVERALEYLVRLDSLTGIPNRRLFEEELSKEWARAKRNHAPFSLIMADIDHFKEYNDHYGHPAGDLCLVEVAQAMHHALSRPGDVVARIGGEEFAFLLPQTDLSGAIAVAEQIRERILALNFPHEASPVASHVTLSFGVSSSELASVSSPADLIRTSDIALYEAKRCGRNQIVAAQKTASVLGA
ncbi:MAG: GGDEF domain-containing protein [Hydrogenophilales bacterium 28-61-11]|nr:MAG: GGDEF domain-containing protein [Hydrogenophilales bacterium 28-61-11]OYZ56992.1 MAG: GGDEF domain-containing protein [Hydrogenophilales bacterium 16-61-112]OZA44255.1 MAG: GGDEF domain-containing protein [Hydrogenophilales bacterium 17-61-76]